MTRKLYDKSSKSEIRDKQFIQGRLYLIVTAGINMKNRQTFIIEINDTQQHGWQGTVEWIQGQEKRSFRSVIELLSLMDSVVSEEGGKNN